MKTRFILYAALSLATCLTLLSSTCSPDPEPDVPGDNQGQDEELPIKVSENTWDIDEAYVPDKDYDIPQIWAGEYKGYDANQKANTNIKRILVLNPNGTYRNIIQGEIVGSDKNKMVDFERETGKYVYNPSTRLITYTVLSDSCLNYREQSYTGYSKKHYYAPNNGTSNDKQNYTELVQFTKPDSKGRHWVTFDTYLQSLTAERIDIAFQMDVFKGDLPGNTDPKK